MRLLRHPWDNAMSSIVLPRKKKLVSLFDPLEWTSQDEFINHIVGNRMIDDAVLADVEDRVTEMFLDSPAFAIRNYMKTVGKRQEMMAVDPFLGQTLLLLGWYSQFKRNMPQRIVEIKPRQVGWTTLLLCLGFWKAMHHFSKVHFFVKDEDVAGELMVKIGTIFNELPPDMRPKKRFDNVSEIVFENPDARTRDSDPGLSSSIRVAVPSAKRGSTSGMAVLSEFAHYNEDVMMAVTEGVLNGMALIPESCIFVDTTPNGKGDTYEEMVEEAIERNPKWVKTWSMYGTPTRQDVIDGMLGEPDAPEEGWIPIFAPARWHEEYCQIASTRVSTARGLLKITDVCVGDMTDFGAVSACYEFKKRATVRITTESGRQSESTLNHPFMTMRGWVVAGDITKDDALLTNATSFSSIQQKIDNIAVDESVGRLLGYYMSDGCLGKKGALSIACDAQDPEVASDARDLLEGFVANFPGKSHTKAVSIRPHNGSLVVSCARLSFTEFFKRHDMFDGSKRIVCVPDIIFRSQKKVVREFLRSLFEGDGYAPDSRKNGVSLGSKHNEFLRHVQLLLGGFGIRSRIYRNDRRALRGKNHPGWVLHLRNAESLKFINEIGFVSKRKQARAEHYASDLRNGKKSWNRLDQRAVESEYERVVAIDDAGEQNVYDISVPGTHMFVANGLVVHNTTRDEHPAGQLPALSKKKRDHIVSTLGKIERYGGEAESELFHKYGASLGHIAWCRYKIDVDTPGADWRYKWLTHNQEFARDWQSCFVDYDFSPFDIVGLQAMREQCMPTPQVGWLEKQTNKYGVQCIVLNGQAPLERQKVKIWAPPIAGEDYMLTADLSTHYESEQADYNVGQIWRRRDHKLCAVYRGKVPPHMVRDQLFLLHRWYNNALTAVETNTSFDMVRQLWDMGCRNQYRWRKYEVDIPEATRYLGWMTDAHTRPKMDGAIVEALSELAEWYKQSPAWKEKNPPPIIVRDERTASEIAGLKRNKEGKLAGAGKKHDDHAICTMIYLAIERDPSYAYLPPKRSEQMRELNTLVNRFKLGYDGPGRNISTDNL
jgi:intein/homing endonuclease